MNFWQVMSSALGPVLIAASDRDVRCVASEQSEDDLRARFPDQECPAAGGEYKPLADPELAIPAYLAAILVTFASSRWESRKRAC